MPSREPEPFDIRRTISSEDAAGITDTIVSKIDANDRLSTPLVRGLILVRPDELTDRMKRSGILTHDKEQNVAKILEPTLTSALNPVEVPVHRLKFTEYGTEWATLRLMLADVTRTLTDERRAYLARARGHELSGDHYGFDILLARVRTELANISFLKQLKPAMPKTITLEAVSSWSPDSVPKTTLPSKKGNSFGLADPLNLPPRITSQDIRAVRPIPQSLLDSLRPKE